MGEDKELHLRKQPLYKLLVERGLVETEDQARRFIMAGNVMVNDLVSDKPGMAVHSSAIIRIKNINRFASRGGYKLAVALDYFQVSVKDRIALDCGAAAGGFTDCLLQNGARLVYAVEVGVGQLLGRLRQDPRVKNLERTNLSDVQRASLNPLPSLITYDLSYLSLTQALPIARTLLDFPGEIITLFKPLFEVESQEARRTGKVVDQALIVDALLHVLDLGKQIDLTVLGCAKLALRPRYGVSEYILHFTNVHDSQKHPAWSYDRATLTKIVEQSGIGKANEEGE